MSLVNIPYPSEVVGHVLKHLRKQAGYTQEAIAQMLDMARTTIVAIEAGQRSLHFTELQQILQVYQMDVQTFSLLCDMRYPDADGTRMLPIQRMAELRVTNRLLKMRPSKYIPLTLRLFSLEQNELEEMAAALLHVLVGQEMEGGRSDAE